MLIDTYEWCFQQVDPSGVLVMENFLAPPPSRGWGCHKEPTKLVKS